MAPARKRRLGPARNWIAAIAVSLLALAAAVPSAAVAVPANFWGVSPQAIPTVTEFQRLRAGGVDSVRIPIGWSAIQRESGAAADFSSVDPLVSGAVQAGLEVFPFVYDAPSWVVPLATVPGSRGTTRAPKFLPVRSGFQRSSWSSFVKLVVARYGPGGSFWAENPALPVRPLRTWQVWNEENFKYFVVRPNPAEYGKLVKLSHAAIKSVDPGAKIVLGGMFAEPREAQFRAKPPQAYFATDFLDKLYRSTPGIKSKFDGVALHPYSGDYKELTSDIEEFRAVLKEHNDAGAGLWITEIGWSSQPLDPKHNSFAKGPQGQAKQLKGAFKLFKARQAKWRLKQIFWFSVDDRAGVCNFCDGSGLFANGFLPKPAWYAYVKFAGGSPG